ncbi:MAG: DUF6125 family protein [Dehalococcoidales bacterium]
MLKLTDKQIIEFFKRSYTSVDGLWFMKAEEKYDFDSALELDLNVWKIMPKIQARMLKPLADAGSPLKNLLLCLTTKLSIEDFVFEVEDNTDAGNFAIAITKCPWFNLMIKSQREHLAGKVGTVICGSEYQVWAEEFDKGISFAIESKMCDGAKHCVFRFNI